ncbi:unnamed protein product [Somion occarium]
MKLKLPGNYACWTTCIVGVFRPSANKGRLSVEVVDVPTPGRGENIVQTFQESSGAAVIVIQLGVGINAVKLGSKV